MGNVATPESLVVRWGEAAASAALIRERPDGVTASEVSILTRIGIRVPDVIWASADFMRRLGEITPLVQAPEVCVEIVSPSSVQAEIEAKRRAYLAAGACEVWLVSEDGTIRFFDASGEQPASRFAPGVSLPSMKGNP